MPREVFLVILARLSFNYEWSFFLFRLNILNNSDTVSFCGNFIFQGKAQILRARLSRAPGWRGARRLLRGEGLTGAKAQRAKCVVKRLMEAK